MADGVPFHGKNGYIYLGGVAVCRANAWTFAEPVATVETTQFCDTHTRNVAGLKSNSGNITAMMHQDKRTLIDANGTEKALYVYPDRTDATNYWYGTVLVSNVGADGSTTSAVGLTADWINGSDGNGVTWIGFA